MGAAGAWGMGSGGGVRVDVRIQFCSNEAHHGEHWHVEVAEVKVKPCEVGNMGSKEVGAGGVSCMQD